MELSWTYRDLGQGGTSSNRIRDWCKRSNGDIYCVAPDFIAYTGNNGVSWSITADDIGYPVLGIYASLIANTSGRVIAGGSRDTPAEFITRKTDNGTTWDYKDDFDFTNTLVSLKQIGSRIWAVVNNGTNPTGRLYYTDDWGNNWYYKSVPWPQNNDIIYHDGYLYIGGSYSSVPKVNRSNDNGDSWGGDIVTGLASASHINKLTVFQDNLYAATEDGKVYKFNTSTLVWSSVFSSLTNSTDLEVIKDELWVVGFGTGERVWSSKDGTTWTGEGFSSYDVASVFIDTDTDIIYLGCTYNRVYTSSVPSVLPPVKLLTQPDIYTNIISWENGSPNDNFSNLNNWLTFKSIGSETAEVSSNKLKQTIIDSTAGIIINEYKYDIPQIGDFRYIIDLDNYSSDDDSNPPIIYISIQSKNLNGIEGTECVEFSYWFSSSIHYVKCGYKINNSWAYESTLNPSSRPSKIHIFRIGSYFRVSYFVTPSWTQALERDWGNERINLFKKVILKIKHNNNRGGYVEWKNNCIIPYNSYFFKETFETLNNIIIYDANEYTIGLQSGAVRLLAKDNLNSYIYIMHKISKSYCNSYVEVDLINYYAEASGTDNALKAIFMISDMAGYNKAFITYQNKAAGHRAYLTHVINNGTPTVGSEYALTAKPTKLRLESNGQNILAYVYDSSWIEIDSISFSGSVPLLSNIILGVNSTNNRGGYSDFDNINHEIIVNSYNIYWRKDKCPDCYFNNLDDFTIVKKEGTETAEIQDNTLLIDLPNTLDTELISKYKFAIESGDFEIIFDFSNYTSDSGEGFELHFRITDNLETSLDYADIFYRSRVSSPANVIGGNFRINGVNNFTTPENPANIPTKIRVRRVGTIIYIDYYSNDIWSNHDLDDFESRAINLINLWILANDLSLVGGSVNINKITVYPSVIESGNKISDVLDLTYDHDSLDSETVYCYKLKAEGSESIESEEVYGLTEAETQIPDVPTIVGLNGDSENIIIVLEVDYATIYNIYWSLESGVTKENGTKIQITELQYNHINLTRQNYYYVVTAENEYGESDISDEICLKPDFEGKIFDHDIVMKERILYQYRKREN